MLKAARKVEERILPKADNYIALNKQGTFYHTIMRKFMLHDEHFYPQKDTMILTSILMNHLLHERKIGLKSKLRDLLEVILVKNHCEQFSVSFVMKEMSCYP